MKTTIVRPEQLIALFSIKGYRLMRDEAQIILGYLDGHAYSVLFDEEHNLWLKDVNEPDGHEEACEPEDIVDFCVEQSAKLITTAENDDEDDNELYLDGLKEDEQAIDCVAQRIMRINKHRQPIEYDVRITETLSRIVKVEARSAAEAEDLAGDRWRNSEWILGADDFADVSFTALV